jgi:hypothetical protein
MNKIDTYILLIAIGTVIGASALIYYMHNDKIGGDPGRWPELTVTQMEFTTLSDSDIVILHVTSTCTPTVTVAVVKINGYTQNKITGDPIRGLTFETGESGTITVEHDWTTGNKYVVSLFIADGTMVGGYTDTA